MNRRSFIFKIIITILSFEILPKNLYADEVSNNPPHIGTKAPYFNLTGSNTIDKNKSSWDLNEFKNKWLVIYFYPKDFTSGCTIEARGFKLITNELSNKNTAIIGISADSIIDHESFCSKEDLNYPLLSDSDGEVSKLYGSWNKPYSTRNTFLIDPNGIIKYRWIGVRPLNHSKQVLEVIDELQNKEII